MNQQKLQLNIATEYSIFPRKPYDQGFDLSSEMTSRLNEDERNERAIRNLLKLPENRRCINCNSLGPQYVCTSFWTFVCTTCSGIHREFTHRVKSVSMAKFTSQEVSALQGGGNASAKEIYFKEWDPQHQSLPDSSNVQRLREFIKHVYVDKRYTDAKSFNKVPEVKVGETKESYREASRSPPFRPSPGGSPPTARVNDRKLEDRFKVEFQSPDHQKDPDFSSPPAVRPVRDILGDKVSLKVIEPPKVNGPRPSQRSVSSNENPTEHKTESSLIDFDAVSEPPSITQVPQTASSVPSITQPSNNNWANFDSIQEMNTSKSPSNPNLLDILSELSVPPSLPAPQQPGNTQFSPFVDATDGGQLQNQASSQLFNQAVAGSQNNQPYYPSVSGNAQVVSSSQVAQSQVTHVVDVKPIAKKELPVDLFSSNYSSFATPGPGWFPAQQYGTGFIPQYNVPMSMPPSYLQTLKPSNPFDVNQSSPVQGPTFPSMRPLQGDLPNIHRTSSLGAWMPTQSSHQLLPPTSIHRTTSLGTPSTQSSHPLSMSQPQLPSYGSSMPSRPFMGQVAPNVPSPSRPQVGGFGVDNTSFGSYNFSQHQSGGNGNPFG